ncbi:glycosyltransferase [Paenibacillus sp. SYP-B4298]|uniref:glycosyltransferase n=1 Tax=Paenibacillus sp. SYP-B4298 TaxID=2996034 RepID=UPI0022DD2C24|nr:glycosyltransferase [Paenibacillus sp. SYP-B4298]
MLMPFSVLISVYDKELPSNLEEALDSIFRSTILPAEVVLVKDGPLNSALDHIIDKYKIANPKIMKIIPLPENVGLGEALKLGVNYCSCELIARMDSDDICTRDRFELQLNVFKEDPSLDVVGGHIYEFENDIKNIISKRIMPLTERDFVKYSINRNPLNHVTVMFKKQSVLDVGNYESTGGIGFEDYLLWVKMILDGKKIKNINHFLVYVRTGNEMIKRRGGRRYISNAVKFRIRVYKMGFCGLQETFITILINIFVGLSPKFIRKQIYFKILRRE